MIKLTDKQAVALVSIVQYHNKESNMTLHCVEVLARNAVKEILKQLGEREVIISDNDIKS